jgi:hypothetical protein
MESTPVLPPIPEGADKYEILGVVRDATHEELRVAYRRLALLCHPDRHPEEDREQAGHVFRRVAAAYETLSHPAERRRYDLALSRNEEFRDSGTHAREVSLQEILAGLDKYEHMFSADMLFDISPELDGIVQKQLRRDFGEEIVDAWPMPAAPTGVTHRGSFQRGALVLTNLRILMPFIYRWQETHGNVRTTYTGAGMPALMLPLLKSIVVVTEKRVKPQVWVDFQHEGGTIRIRSRQSNLSKLLLVAGLWGVSVDARQEDARGAELRWALLQPWQMAAVLTIALFACASAWSIFDGGIIDNPIDLAEFVARVGIWQWVVITCAAVCGRRLWKWVFAYAAADLAAAIEANGVAGEKGAELARAAAGAST